VKASAGSTVQAGVQRAALQAIGDALDVGVLSVDRQLSIIAWNEWLATVTGKKASDAIGRSLLDVEPMLKPTVRASLERAFQGATVLVSQGLHEYFIDAPPPAGFDRFERMQQSARVLPLVGDDGQIDGAVVIIQDVTERVSHEAELRAALETAQRANQAKSEFLAAMSHELRTPIGAISGYADILTEGISGPVSPPQQAQLKRIKTVAAHLLSIVDQILNFARIEADREPPNRAPSDAAAMARDAVTAVAPLAEQKGLTLDVRVPEGSIVANTDPTWVRQVLINLLGNAIKFTDRGHVSLELVVRDETTLQFVVGDSGCGIAAVDLGRIFEPFVQADMRHRSLGRSGTGLGLSVSRELARRLGGDITVTSDVGKGSWFTATITR
jgi:signal transduction histidine kinase